MKKKKLDKIRQKKKTETDENWKTRAPLVTENVCIIDEVTDFRYIFHSSIQIIDSKSFAS